MIFIYSRYDNYIEHKLCKAFDRLYNQKHFKTTVYALYTARVNDACLPTTSSVPRRRLDPETYRSRGEPSTTEPRKSPPDNSRSLQN